MPYSAEELYKAGDTGHDALEAAGMHTLKSGPSSDWLGLEFGGDGWAQDPAIKERATEIINGLELGIPFEIISREPLANLCG